VGHRPASRHGVADRICHVVGHALGPSSRENPVSRTPVADAGVDRRSSRSATAAGAGYFAFHFAEMLVAMMLGMMVFVPVRLALTAQGYTALLDASSVDF
jgi:hypothetical protein